MAFSLDKKRGFPDLTLAEYQQFSDHFSEDVFGVLDLTRALESRTTTGAPSFANVDQELSRWEEALA